VFEFHSGMSPFVAFELPAQTVPYRVRVKSLFDAKSDDDAVFYPVVALLDDTYIVTQMTGLDNLRLEPALATVGGETGLAVSIGINPAEQRVRYLVVFTPAALLGAPPDSRREGDLLTPSSIAWLGAENRVTRVALRAVADHYRAGDGGRGGWRLAQ
jgi:hypothetical protein